MKTLGLMLTRNEAHILPYTLPPLAKICDHIIIADQQSDDGTRAIIKKCKNATLIDNPPSPPDGNYDTQGRQLLFDTARQQYDGNNLFLCVDADELAPPAVFHNIKDYVHNYYKPGVILQTPWVRLWKDNTTYCMAWKGGCHDPMHNWLFYDDRTTHYSDSNWVHSGRTPYHHKTIERLPLRYGLLHFHWVFWQRALWQQAWYQMLEFINKDFDRADVARINQGYYDPALLGAKVLTRRLPQQWRTGYNPPPLFPKESNHWRKEEVMRFIKQHGIEVFEPLNIWYVDELREMFEQAAHRPPQAAMPPPIYVPTKQLSVILKTPERMIRTTQWYRRLKGRA